MWYIIVPSVGLIIFVRVVVRRSRRRLGQENKRIKEQGYMALLTSSEPTPDQRLRQAYFTIKRREEELDHEQRILTYDQREVGLQKQENALTLQEIMVTRERITVELEQKKAEIVGLLKEVEYARRDLDLSTREQNLFISERKFDLLKTAFQKHMQFEKTEFELARQQYLLTQKELQQQLREHGLLLKSNELALEAKRNGLLFEEGLLKLQHQRRDNDLNHREQTLELSRERYRNQMQRKENELYVKLGLLRNEQRALQVEKRASELQEYWDRIVERGRERVRSLGEVQDQIKKRIRWLLQEKKDLEQRR